MLRVLSFAALIPFSSQPAHAASFSAFVAGGLILMIITVGIDLMVTEDTEMGDTEEVVVTIDY